MERIAVNASKSYEVLIGDGILGDIGAEARACGLSGAAAIVADSKTDALFADDVALSLEDAGFSPIIKYVIKSGECSKNTSVLVSLLEFFAKHGITRSDTVFALGGGVVGDLAGFAAAVYLRGIRFVQLPTTLLAAVDSSVGGKTAVNLPCGKNLVGAFYQPSLVMCDCDTLKALPKSVFFDGCGEVIKYGAIADAELLNLLSGDISEILPSIVARCVAIKRDIVCADEFDCGSRQLLNFGHTAAHAIELCSGFSVSHGSAVAIGMVIMARAAEKHGLCPSGIADELYALAKRFSLPTHCAFTADELYRAALSDKKRTHDGITLVVPSERGHCVLYPTSCNTLFDFLKAGMEALK